jgi:hypothetical protein
MADNRSKPPLDLKDEPRSAESDSEVLVLTDEERRDSARHGREISVSFEIAKMRFFGITTNMSDDGMLIEAAITPDKARKLFNTLLKDDEKRVTITYSIDDKDVVRQGAIKHYHLDYLGQREIFRVSLGVWIPKRSMRDEKDL